MSRRGRAEINDQEKYAPRNVPRLNENIKLDQAVEYFQKSARLGSTGLMSMTDVPSMASMGPTRRRFLTSLRTVTR